MQVRNCSSLVFMSRLYYSARTRVDTLGGNAGGMALALPQFNARGHELSI